MIIKYFALRDNKNMLIYLGNIMTKEFAKNGTI